jgi:hypothetical protein
MVGRKTLSLNLSGMIGACPAEMQSSSPALIN